MIQYTLPSPHSVSRISVSLSRSLSLTNDPSPSGECSSPASFPRSLSHFKHLSATSTAFEGISANLATFNPEDSRLTPRRREWEYTMVSGWKKDRRSKEIDEWSVIIEGWIRPRNYPQTHCRFVNVSAKEIDACEIVFLRKFSWDFFFLFPPKHIRQFMEVSGEQGSALVCVVKFMDSCESNRKSDWGCCSSSYFITDDQRLRSCSSQDLTISTTEEEEKEGKEESEKRKRNAKENKRNSLKVLRSLKRSSFAPTRLKTLSTIPTLASSAGTKLPDWARIEIKAFCRRNVDLPPIFGPVISWTLEVS